MNLKNLNQYDFDVLYEKACKYDLLLKGQPRFKGNWKCPFCEVEYTRFGRMTTEGLAYHLYMVHERELTLQEKCKE